MGWRKEEEEMTLCVTHSSQIMLHLETCLACIELLSMIYFIWLLAFMVNIYTRSSHHKAGLYAVAS